MTDVKRLLTENTSYESRKHLPIEKLVEIKRRERMEKIDALPKELRECVHDYGFAVVKVLAEMGVTKPKNVRHIVETILNEFSPTRGSFSIQGRRVHQDG